MAEFFDLFSGSRKRWMGVATGVVLAGFAGWLKFSALPGAASSIVDLAAEHYDLEVEVDTWKADLLDLRLTAEDLRWRVRGRYSSDELMTADSVTIDLGAWKLLTSGFDVLAAAELGRRLRWS